MQGAAALEQIKASSGCFEPGRVTEYRGSRVKRDGSHQQVTIRVFDREGEEEHPRFHVGAQADELERIHRGELDS